jgi:hypothetical protein
VGDYTTYPGLEYKDELKIAATEELNTMAQRRRMKEEEIVSHAGRSALYCLLITFYRD